MQGRRRVVTMTDWVPVMAPPELAARFLREFAHHVARGGETEPRRWEDATGADIKAFVGGLNDQQRALVVSLAFTESPPPRGRPRRASRRLRRRDRRPGRAHQQAGQEARLDLAHPLPPCLYGRKDRKGGLLDDRVALWVRDHYEKDNRSLPP